MTPGRAQALAELASARPDARLVCWMRDQYRAQLVEESVAAPNLSVLCAPDPPADTIDLAVVPTSMRGEAELTRETLQEAVDRLELGGVLIASTDNPRDVWLRQQMDALFTGVRRHGFDDAVVYAATKKKPLRKRRNFACEFVFRDRDRLLKAVSRPGVFSHRHIDPGARHLLAAAEVGAGNHVLDIGCGAGTVALALAARDPSACVHAVDSDARAVECTLRGALLNGLTNVTAELNAFGDYRGAGSYDLVVTNPPYYADNQIASRMIESAHQSLKLAGRLLLVTKAPDRCESQLIGAPWRDLQITPSKGYFVLSVWRS